VRLAFVGSGAQHFTCDAVHTGGGEHCVTFTRDVNPASNGDASSSRLVTAMLTRAHVAHHRSSPHVRNHGNPHKLQQNECRDGTASEADLEDAFGEGKTAIVVNLDAEGYDLFLVQSPTRGAADTIILLIDPVGIYLHIEYVMPSWLRTHTTHT
jgi:hypothetical protein